jgi:putative FmdB family regulatory protein
MPTYEYRCTVCLCEFEKLQQMSEKKITACPECGCSVVRLISKGSPPIFKGSGFYETDYKQKRS